MTLQQRIKNSVYTGLISLISILGCDQSKTSSTLNIESYKRSSQGVISGYQFVGATDDRKKANLIYLNYKSKILEGKEMSTELEWPLIYDPNDQKLINAVYHIESGDTIDINPEGYITNIKPSSYSGGGGHGVTL